MLFSVFVNIFGIIIYFLYLPIRLARVKYKTIPENCMFTNTKNTYIIKTSQTSQTSKTSMRTSASSCSQNCIVIQFAS